VNACAQTMQSSQPFLCDIMCYMLKVKLKLSLCLKYHTMKTYSA